MQKAIQEAVKTFATQLKAIAGENIQSMSINIVGSPQLIDTEKEMITNNIGLMTIQYQTETITTPLHTDFTLIIRD